MRHPEHHRPAWSVVRERPGLGGDRRFFRGRSPFTQRSGVSGFTIETNSTTALPTGLASLTSLDRSAGVTRTGPAILDVSTSFSALR